MSALRQVLLFIIYCNVILYTKKQTHTGLGWLVVKSQSLNTVLLLPQPVSFFLFCLFMEAEPYNFTKPAYNHLRNKYIKTVVHMISHLSWSECKYSGNQHIRAKFKEIRESLHLLEQDKQKKDKGKWVKCTNLLGIEEVHDTGMHNRGSSRFTSYWAQKMGLLSMYPLLDIFFLVTGDISELLPIISDEKTKV